MSIEPKDIWLLSIVYILYVELFNIFTRNKLSHFGIIEDDLIENTL